MTSAVIKPSPVKNTSKMANDLGILFAKNSTSGRIK